MPLAATRDAMEDASGARRAAPTDLRVHARSLALLYLVGATIVVVTTSLYRPAHQDEATLYALAGLAYATALLLHLASRWLRSWIYPVLVGLGTLLITLGINASGQGASTYAAFYVWIAVYSYYFFPRWQANAELALAGLAYALVLELGPPSSGPFARWAVTMGTLTVAGRLVASLVDQVRARATEATARAERLRDDISERQGVEQAIREHAEDMTRVADVARDLAGVTDAHAARPAICKAAQELGAAKLAILYEPDPKGQELVSTAVVGAQIEQIHLPFSGPPSGAATAFSSGQVHFISDLAGNPGVAAAVRDQLGVVSALWQPVLRNGVPIGVLTLAWDRRVAEVSERVRSLMGLLAAETAVAIERADLLARLEAVARTDDLTGLANRRAWDEHLPRELARARREERPVCVAMLDLDRFKEYNDQRGHPAGDRLLKLVAATWREMLRPSDLLARYGGEEFGLLLPTCPLEQGLEVVERLRTCTIAGQTCSAGVAAWDFEEPLDALVSRADRALYEAKKTGRDRAIAAR
jgi:diguanylate cyclase (GGDEF)-like protein